MHRAQNCVIDEWTDERTAARSTDVQTRMYFRFIATIVSYWLRMSVHLTVQISKSTTVQVVPAVRGDL